MTADEARERFSEAYEGELSEKERRAFQAALGSSPALAAEYESFRSTMRTLGKLATGDDDAPSILPHVQAKLRARSGGKFYRDRFSQTVTKAWLLPVAVMLAIVVMMGLAFLGYRVVTTEEVESPPPSLDAPR